MEQKKWLKHTRERFKKALKEIREARNELEERADKLNKLAIELSDELEK